MRGSAHREGNYRKERDSAGEHRKLPESHKKKTTNHNSRLGLPICRGFVWVVLCGSKSAPFGLGHPSTPKRGARRRCGM